MATVINTVYEWQLDDIEMIGKSNEEISLYCCEQCYFEGQGGDLCQECKNGHYWEIVSL